MFRGLVFIFLIILASLNYVIRAEDDIIIETTDEKDASRVGDQAGRDAGTSSTAQDGSPLSGDETAGATGPLITASPDVDTTVYFTFPQNAKDIPTNKPIRILIGFRNKGQNDFMVDYLDASLRYPMDYSYIITNFTSIRYSRHVPAQQEATFDYGFFLHDAFASRPFTLSVNLHYHDAADKLFVNAVYNETIQVVEVDEGLDSQTFFLYVMFAAILVLLGLLGNHYFASYAKKRPGVKRIAKAVSNASGNGVESGTSKSSDVDYDWLPESTLRTLSKSPKKSPTQSRSPQQSPKAKKQL